MVAKDRDRGYSLVEVLVALSIGLVVVATAFLLLEGGRTALAREPQVAEMNANVRTALDRVSADLTVAGIGTPSELAVLWHDGVGGGTDEIIILYADGEAPIGRPLGCEGACDSIRSQSTLLLDPASLHPEPVDYGAAYAPGTILLALQSPLAGPDCAGARPAMVWFELTDTPRCSTDSGTTRTAEGCGALTLNHGPVHGLAANLPEGVHSEVDPGCAFVGAFHAIQYRISSGELERRDLFQGESFSPVAANVEDFQLQYVQGFQSPFEDTPAVFPSATNPSSWLTAVRITVAVASGDQLSIRRSLSTTVSLRNQLGQASIWPTETAAVGWN